MKKELVLIIFLISCAQTTQTVEFSTQPQEPIPSRQEMPTITTRPLLQNTQDIIIAKDIKPYKIMAADAEYDSFGIVPVQRHDANYAYQGINTTAHTFLFNSREELEFVLFAAFFEAIQRGARNHQGNIILLYLSQEDHRIAVWSSGTKLVYIDTAIPDFAALEIINAYLEKYPSDLETPKCIDSDSANHYLKGTVTRVRIGESYVHWEDTCLADFAPYRNNQYKTVKGITAPDGLLEGMCTTDPYVPGYINEHACPRGCKDGACKIS